MTKRTVGATGKSEYGGAQPWPHFGTEGHGNEFRQLVGYLTSRAEKMLPPGTRYELRGEYDSGFMTKGVYWYSKPHAMHASGLPWVEKLYLDAKEMPLISNSYFLVKRSTTPKAPSDG